MQDIHAIEIVHGLALRLYQQELYDDEDYSRICPPAACRDDVRTALCIVEDMLVTAAQNCNPDILDVLEAMGTDVRTDQKQD